MAEMKNMVPVILNREVGLKKEELNLDPKEMFASVSKRGFHIIKNDKGGPTMCGVTFSTFSEWRRRIGKPKPSIDDLKSLSFDEWIAILKNLFWDPCKADEIANDSIAMMIVDWRWVNGSQAIRSAQVAFSLVPDGVVGPKTLGALNSAPAKSVFERLRYARERSYFKIVQNDKSQEKFLKGWINRTNSISFSD